MAGRLPPARIWSSKGAFALKVRTGVISPLRWGEPDPPRSVRGRPKLPQGSGFCFDATAPHLFPGVCSRGEEVRLTLYVEYGAPVQLGGAAASGSIGWGTAAAGEPAGDVRTAFDADGEYRLRSTCVRWLRCRARRSAARRRRRWPASRAWAAYACRALEIVSGACSCRAYSRCALAYAYMCMQPLRT